MDRFLICLSFLPRQCCFSQSPCSADSVLPSSSPSPGVCCCSERLPSSWSWCPTCPVVGGTSVAHVSGTQTVLSRLLPRTSGSNASAMSKALGSISRHQSPGCERSLSRHEGESPDFCMHCGLRLQRDCDRCGYHHLACSPTALPVAQPLPALHPPRQRDSCCAPTVRFSLVQTRARKRCVRGDRIPQDASNG